MLHQTPILIVEDDPIISIALDAAITDARGTVIGPCTRLQQALALLETSEPQAAVLPLVMPDGETLPLIEALSARGIPMVIQTGREIPLSIARRFPGLPIVPKPFLADDLVGQLRRLVDGHFTDDQAAL
jgi:DNA-binding NtrC family response regulator